MKWITALILSFLPVFAMAGTTTQTIYIDLPAEKIKTVHVRCGAGSLDIKGVPGISQIKVAAAVEMENIDPKSVQTFLQQNIRLSLTQHGNTALLTASVIQPGSSKIEARINLSIEIPAVSDLSVTDGSGPILVQDIQGKVDIHDDSGEITVTNVIGAIRLEDGSGGITVENCHGSVSVKDGSGFIVIDDVRGDVMVTDGSGYMSILHITGNVTIRDDSGDIDISDISGAVFIKETGTGELNLDRIQGTVTKGTETIQD